MNPVRRDEGVATIWAMTLVLMLAVVALVGAVAGARAVQRARAAAVADVAAIAGAESGCSAAQEVVRRNGMLLGDCSIDAGDVLVRVTVPPGPELERLLALVGRPVAVVSATARAGPLPVPSPSAARSGE